MREAKKQASTVELEASTVKQMLSLYRAVLAADASYTEGAAQYRLRAIHISEAASACNVKRAFEAAAQALGESL